MDNNTGDNQSNLPKASKEELEEALKWLEELSARAEEKAAASGEPEFTSPPESPFFGMLETGEDDMPDWLKEITTAPETPGEGEAESRLDWLAKMAQRESIEELPTLEWRRFTSPYLEEQPAITQELAESKAEDTSGRPSAEAPPQGSADPTNELHLENSVHIDEPGPSPVLEDTGIEEPPSESTFDDLDAAMAWIEELAASQEAPIEDLPSVADRALTSKLLLGVGLTDNALDAIVLPEDLDQLDELETPASFASDEDPADTIVLVETMAAESGRPFTEVYPSDHDDQDPAAIEILPSESESESPDQDTDNPDLASVVEPITGTISPKTPLEEPAAISFEEAIAYLEELAVIQTTSESPAESVEDLPPPEAKVTEDDPEMAYDESMFYVEDEIVPGEEELISLDIDPEETKVEPPPIKEIDVGIDLFADEESLPEIESESFEPFAAALIGTSGEEHAWNSRSNGVDIRPLEVALLTLDNLALPQGQSLDKIDNQIRLSLTSTTTSPKSALDLPSILDWLEEIVLEDEPSEDNLSVGLADEQIIQMMPEDPDEALAWLIRMASEESEPVTLGQGDAVLLSSKSPDVVESPAADLVELSSGMPDGNENFADLMSMPDDPDEAMAWLESLAESDESSQISVIPQSNEITAPIDKEISPSLEKITVPPISAKVAGPRRPARKAATGTAWVDLLKPLEK
jgi:uncharacterized protein Smg (DUF494 family)